MRRNLNEFLICNSSYIYNCAQDYREAAAFAFAKKPVLHEECAMLKFRICLFLLTSLTECAQRTLERPLSSLAVLRCGQSATQEKIYRCACVHTDFRLHSLHSKAAELLTEALQPLGQSEADLS